jgi:hypothetical protein
VSLTCRRQDQDFIGPGPPPMKSSRSFESTTVTLENFRSWHLMKIVVSSGAAGTEESLKGRGQGGRSADMVRVDWM